MAGTCSCSAAGAVHALIVAQRQALSAAQAAKARMAAAEVPVRELVIEQMKFTVAKLRPEQFGQTSERGALLEQLELQLADLEEDAQARIAADAAARQIGVPSHNLDIIIEVVCWLLYSERRFVRIPLE
jgi:Transposase C of IS166 homeodomain